MDLPLQPAIPRPPALNIKLLLLCPLSVKGRKFALTKAQVRPTQAAMAQRDTSVFDLCKELGIERVTLYRYVGPKGELRDYKNGFSLGLSVGFRPLPQMIPQY